jgi:hypothetical protein
MSKLKRWQRELANDTKQADYLIIGARAEYGNQAVDDFLQQTYYIVPPDAPMVRCPHCEVNLSIDWIHIHLRDHRGSYACQKAECYDRRFKTYRGYLQHFRKAHPKPPFPGGK